MLRIVLLLVSVVVTLAFRLGELPEPGEFALVFDEDQFEDYLDEWLAIEEPKWINAAAVPRNGGCSIKVNGDLGQPQPVYLKDNNYVVPTGNTGIINLATGESIYVACTGSGRTIRHPNVVGSTATGWATCVNDAIVSGNGWLSGNGQFGDITCSSNSYHEAEATSEKCYNNNTVIRVGFYVDNVFYPKYWSCFDQSRLEVLYSWYEQNPPNAAHQTSVARPSWLELGNEMKQIVSSAAGSFFPGIGINNLYTQVQQKNAIAGLVGQELADKYVTSSQYLARGHLAAKTDFIFATGQRATFYFINAAPQWQPFNGGNWNWLEQNLRARVGVAGYNTTVYTGTFGVSQLRDQNNNLVDIYLYKDANNNPQLPVPLYYYKVVYEPTLRLGTAFVGINNPYYTEAEVKALTFCTDKCRNNNAFDWLKWQPDRIDIGYSFCCTIDDFRKTVPHLPAFTVDGLLS